MEIHIAHLYPDMLNLYSDIGNIKALERRMKLRDIDVEITSYKLDDKIDFKNTDIILLGGGSDKDQKIVYEKLISYKEDFKNYVEHDGVILAFCWGYEILGNYIEKDGKKVEGLGLLDIYTKYDNERIIGDIILKSDIPDTTIVGFENHAGRVYSKNHTPLGNVKYGFGNNETDKKEGVIYKNVIASYIHGPLLPKNPKLTDYIIEKSLEKKYSGAELTPLDDTKETIAHNYILNRYL